MQECWLDKLTKEERIQAYLDWRDEKKSLGEDDANITLAEWEQMERTIAARLEGGNR